jgi:hypothetical protein
MKSQFLLQKVTDNNVVTRHFKKIVLDVSLGHSSENLSVPFNWFDSKGYSMPVN